MSNFIEGHVKRDPATGAVAIRTNQPEERPAGSFSGVQAWLIATTFSGAHFAGTDMVADWEDIYAPTPPDPVPDPPVE